ncbi:hypothetical protein ACFXCZ_27160 [Streptomyces sp. NPDC059396]|uniref:hypothetical protein n=1 Tax=Streptomyces sp. NPDC059396 TaxID=3346819 RepID=UPI0036B98835
MFGSKKTDEEKAASKALLELRLASSGVGGMLVRKDPLRFTAPGQMDVPVAGAQVTIDRGEAAKRITATRVALTGIFALALKKDSTKLFVTIEGADGTAMLLECPAKKEGAARKFAMLVHAKHPAPPAQEG